MIKGDVQEIAKLASSQSQEFFTKYHEVIAFFLRRKVFRYLDHDELLKIKIESMAIGCNEALDLAISTSDGAPFVEKAKQLIDFLLEELYLNPEKDFIFNYTSEIVHTIFERRDLSEAIATMFSSLGEIRFRSSSNFTYYNFVNEKRSFTSPKSNTIEKIVRYTITKFKLNQIIERPLNNRRSMRVRSVTNIEWQRLLPDGRDIIDLLKSTEDSSRLKSYILTELEKSDLKINVRISLLAQLVFLLEQEDRAELAFSVSSHLARVLPHNSGDRVMFLKIAEKLCEQVKHVDISNAA